MEDIALFGKRIKEKRLALNLRMDDVAKKANITRATLWAIEKGTGNYSFNTLLKVLSILNLKFELVSSDDKNDTTRDRASRRSSVLDKKINRFIVMCVEQYASAVNRNSDEVYRDMLEHDIIKDLKDDYEDLHGMSTMWLNDYIHSILTGGLL